MIADDDLTYSPPQAAELLAKNVLGPLWSWVGPERLQAAIDEEWSHTMAFPDWREGATIQDWMTPEEAAAFYAPGVTKALSLAIRSGAIEACCRPRRVGERRPMDKGAWLTDDFQPLRFQQGGFFDPEDYARVGADLPYRVELAGADVMRHAGQVMRWSHALPAYAGQTLSMAIGAGSLPGGVFNCGAPVWLMPNVGSIVVCPPVLPLPSQSLPEAANDSALLVTVQTGEPGRPTKSREIYMAEFERRKAAGLVEQTLSVEARTLCAWLEDKHPLAARPATGVVQNNIRAAFNAYWADARKGPR